MTVPKWLIFWILDWYVLIIGTFSECEYFGYEVTRLQRVRIISLELGNLKVGQWRKLKLEEVRALLPHKGKDFNF